jgi:hypothetical protein
VGHVSWPTVDAGALVDADDDPARARSGDAITSFVGPDHAERFGLPASLD